MSRLHAGLCLLIGLLFVFASIVAAEDHQCPQKTDSPCVASDKTDETESDQVDKADDADVQRQKPYYSETHRLRKVERNQPAVDRKEYGRAINAADALYEFSPKDMLDDAEAIAVIPGVKKGAFMFGARWGSGLIARRDENGAWLPPSYIEIGGGNFGFQAGFQSTDLILIFTNHEGVDALLRGKLTLNADASAAVGPFGRDAQVGIPILLSSGIYAYSRSKGLYAGVSLDGATITIDDTSNQRVYGIDASGDAILVDRRVDANDTVEPFMTALQAVSPADPTVVQSGSK